MFVAARLTAKFASLFSTDMRQRPTWPYTKYSFKINVHLNVTVGVWEPMKSLNYNLVV